jgi:hypothetical protein
LAWARAKLAAWPELHPEWLLAFLDSRHTDVRAEGLAWFRDDIRVRDDVRLWLRLVETPHDEIRIALVGALEQRLAGRDPFAALLGAIDPEHLRLLWASVLLNIHRGGRAKPAVLRQLVRRIQERPDDFVTLLPLLAVALRSVRGPEWRAGLAAIVQLLERQPARASEVRLAFPELELV